jgi:hypothetical protein
MLTERSPGRNRFPAVPWEFSRFSLFSINGSEENCGDLWVSTAERAKGYSRALASGEAGSGCSGFAMLQFVSNSSNAQEKVQVEACHGLGSLDYVYWSELYCS